MTSIYIQQGEDLPDDYYDDEGIRKFMKRTWDWEVFFWFLGGIAAIVGICTIVYMIHLNSISGDRENTERDKVKAEACKAIEEDTAQNICLIQLAENGAY